MGIEYNVGRLKDPHPNEGGDNPCKVMKLPLPPEEAKETVIPGLIFIF